MSLTRKYFAAGVIAVLCLGLQARVGQAADPFYSNLLRDGTSARARGDVDAAIEDLRLACFGLLDEPALLASGLVELALAQASAGLDEEMSATVDRLLQVERLFQGYSQASLAADTRLQFDDLLYRRVDPARLEGLAVFQPLTDRREMEAFQTAGPDQRRALLEQRLSADPSNTQWLRMLADLELGQNRPGSAVPYLTALMSQAPSDPLLRCEHFRAATAAGRCDIALENHAACPGDTANAGIAQPILDCYVAESGWQQAADFLATLPPTVRSTSKIRKLERQVNKELRKLPSEPAETETLLADQGSDAQPGRDQPVDTTTEPAQTEVITAPPEAETPGASREDMAAGDSEAGAEVIPEVEREPDPCDPFRAAARRGACNNALADLAACRPAAAEREIAPAIMKCHADAGSWTEALAFAESLPPQVRGLPKIRKLQRRATKQAEKEAEAAKRAAAAAALAAAEEEAPAGDETASPAAEDSEGTALPDEGAPADGDDEVPDKSPNPVGTPSAPSSAELAEARRILANASTSADITRAYAITSKLAMDYPAHQEAQLLAAQGAYRAAQWDKAVGFFQAAGTPGDEQPLLQFYCAISLYETGQPRAAADLLDRALARIRRTPFVDSYVNRIYAAAGRGRR